MKRSPLFVVALLLAGSDEILAQPDGWSISAAAKVNYTTTSRIFSNPDSPSNEIRSQYLAVDDIYGGGLELRFRFPGENIFLSLSAEYLSKRQEQIQPVAFIGAPRRASVQDGLRLIPLELGANMIVPIGSEKVQVSMGGGVGLYYGVRILSVAGVDAPQQNTPLGFGIHVESSIDYRVFPHVSVRGEMRFRDPEVTTENRFTNTRATYNGVVIPLPEESFRTRINVNGLSFGLGVAVDIP